ncbi:hypothetical protein M5689_024876 [Euphorbia peplus]|nr:hypothetical protein M5689_024876 [Euphorbia peplus]
MEKCTALFKKEPEPQFVVGGGCVLLEDVRLCLIPATKSSPMIGDFRPSEPNQDGALNFGKDGSVMVVTREDNG